MHTSPSIWNWLQAAGRPHQARLRRWQNLTRRVEGELTRFENLSESQLRERVAELRWNSQTGGLNDELIVASFAVGAFAIRKTLGLRIYPVQILGGLAVVSGGIAEMQTGEGKTLAALLPAFTRSLSGHGCHVITANDYLAERDAAWNRPVFESLGLRVGCITSFLPAEQRREQYDCDITYSTAREIGFDYLRDRLSAASSSQPRHTPGGQRQGLQRELWFALVDEADSVLIDDARTPLIISLPDADNSVPAELAQWCDESTPQLRLGIDFEFDPGQRTAWLTDTGCRSVLMLPRPGGLDHLDTEQLYRQMEWALVAHNGFLRDRHYLVGQKGIEILDESTGRVLEGRQWQAGLHQALEARERLAITPVRHTAAQISVQRLFRRYRHRGGMTGTALPVAAELRRTFDMTATAIPTHRPCRRAVLPSRVFVTRAAKWAAVAESLSPLLDSGRAVLIGTPSVAASEGLSELLRARGIAHQVLNARFDRAEAEIIARAGQPQQVTIATNMAGRGTDIALDASVAAAGGLHVIATEMHSSARIDRQLIGRCARQGDPGSCQFFLSLEDELLNVHPPEFLATKRHAAKSAGHPELSLGWLRFFEKTQHEIERRHARERRELLEIEEERVSLCIELGLEPSLQVYE